MNFSAARLGFWFRYPFGLPDRSINTKKVLVFYDMYTSVWEGYPTLAYNHQYYTQYPAQDPASLAWPNIRDQEISLGFQPELIVGYNNLPADLTQYSHIWDIGYASPYTENPTFDPTSVLTSYLQAGGAMFILGENASLNELAPSRDSTISTFLSGLGGGVVSESATDYNTSTFVCTVESEFLITNSNTSVTFNRPGTFTALGTGTAMSTAAIGSEYVAIMWKTGSLTNAPRGAVISVLDINFLDNTNLQPDFIDNISASLNQR